MNLAWRTLNHDIMKSSFPLSVCNCLVTHLGASDSLTTMVLYKSIYLLTYLLITICCSPMFLTKAVFLCIMLLYIFPAVRIVI